MMLALDPVRLRFSSSSELDREITVKEPEITIPTLVLLAYASECMSESRLGISCDELAKSNHEWSGERRCTICKMLDIISENIEVS